MVESRGRNNKSFCRRSWAFSSLFPPSHRRKTERDLFKKWKFLGICWYIYLELSLSLFLSSLHSQSSVSPIMHRIRWDIPSKKWPHDISFSTLVCSPSQECETKGGKSVGRATKKRWKMKRRKYFQSEMKMNMIIQGKRDMEEFSMKQIDSESFGKAFKCASFVAVVGKRATWKCVVVRKFSRSNRTARSFPKKKKFICQPQLSSTLLHSLFQHLRSE